MRPTLIVNPYASRVTEERVRELERRLDVVETLLTERSGHATELAARATGDAVFVFGGDGVVNEVLNGLAAGTPLGIVPGGHTNVLARALGVPSDPSLCRPSPPDLARTGQRTPVRLRGRDRRRLRDRPGAGDPRPRP